MYTLQISCIVIVMFLFVLFMAERNFKRESQKLFSGLLIVSVFQILFEILIIYTIQNIETVSPIFFKSVHRTYLTLALTYFYLKFRYMSSFIKEETGEPAKSLGFIHTAQVILYMGIFLLPLGYEKTATSVEFSYGPGVWVVYVGAVFYMFIIFSNYCGQGRRIAIQKIMPLILGVACGMCACFYYMCVPEAQVTCLGVVIVDLAMYLSLRSGFQVPLSERGNLQMAENEQVQDEHKHAYKVLFEAPAARILVVDDSEMNRKVIRNLLKKTLVQVEEASGGKECLELVENNKYHMIFMDHLMPEMDGLETFELIRKHHMCDDVPVVAMTANTISMSEKEYLELGFSGYISKPVVPEKLDVMMYELLDSALITKAEKTEATMSQAHAEQAAEKIQDKDVAAGRKWDELPVVDGLDYQYAALHFQTVDEFEEMVRFLVTVMKADMEEIETYFDTLEDEGCLKNFQTKVHSMKNSAMTIGVVPLAGLAKALEDAAREQREEQVRVLMPVFTERWESYRLMLHKTFGADEGEKLPGDPESEEIKDLFVQLREAATEMDIDALDVIMEKIDSYVFDSRYEEKLQKIRLAVVNFEVEYLQEEGYL